MSGICGVVGLSKKMIDGRNTSSMLEQIKHNPLDTTSTFTDKDTGATLGQIHTNSVAANTRFTAQGFAHARGVIAVAQGRVTNRDDVCAALSVDTSSTSPGDESKLAAAAYRVHGDAFLESFDGPFTAAVWDAEKRRLLLSRDKLGQKSLYYYTDAGQRNLIFGSEIKAILAHPAVEVDVDHFSVSMLLAFGYVPGSRTLFKNVRKLMPGERLAFVPGKRLERKKYWHLPETHDGIGDESTCVRGLRERFVRGLEKSLAGAREVGVFLSGGAASSVIVAALAELGVPRVTTFAFGFQAGPSNRRTDDLEYARLVARQYGTNHHEVVAPPIQSPGPWLALIAEDFDDAMMTPDTYRSWTLAGAACDAGLGTVLTGIGAANDWDVYSQYLDLDLRTRWHHATRGCSRDAERYYTLHGTIFTLADQHVLLRCAPQMRRSDVADELEHYFQDIRGNDFFQRLLTANRIIGSAEESMRVANKIGLLKSMEMCSPFMDRELVEFSSQIPASFDEGSSFVSLKTLLMQAFENEMPQAVLTRRPINSLNDGWQRGALREYQRLLLAPELHSDGGGLLDDDGFFAPAAIASVLDEEERSRAIGLRAWILTQFTLWYGIHVKMSRACA